MRSRRQYLALLVAGGCGRIAFDPLAADAADAAAPADACTLGPWGLPALVPGLDTDDEDSGSQITADGLGLYYATNNHLHAAHRPDRGSPWTTELIAELDGPSQFDPSVTADELELFFTRDDSVSPCIFYTSRTSTSLAWSTPVRLDALCTTRDAGGAYVTADGLTLFYTSTMGVSEGSIYVTTRPDRAAPFPAGTMIAGLPGTDEGTYGYGALSSDLLTLYFESSSPLDLYSATRAALGDPWGAAVPLATVNTADREEDVSITADGLELYFDSDRPSTHTNANIYVATRSCL